MCRRNRSSRKLLEDVYFWVGVANETLSYVSREESYPIEDYDLALLRKIAEKSDLTRTLSLYVEVRFRQRLAGQPETPLPPRFDRE